MKPQLISINQLNKQSHTAYYDLLYQHTNGMRQHYQMLSRNTNLNKDNLGKNNIDAITMLIYKKTAQNVNEYLMTKEFRLPINNFVLSFPAGLVEKNEDILIPAIREIKEETGLDVVIEKGFREISEYCPFGKIRKRVVFFLAQAFTDNVKIQEEEIDSYIWVDLQQARKMCSYDNDLRIIEKAETAIHLLRN